MGESILYELDPEHGKIYINSGTEDRMIVGGQQLAQEYPGYVYSVERDGIAVWNSKDGKEMETMEVAYRLVRIIDGVASVIAPGMKPEHLIDAGKALAVEHPEWILEVQDASLSPIWSNKKSASGKAEDTPSNETAG